MADCFRQTVKNKGVLGLWSGLTPSLLKVRFCFHPDHRLSWSNQHTLLVSWGYKAYDMPPNLLADYRWESPWQNRYNIRQVLNQLLELGLVVFPQMQAWLLDVTTFKFIWTSLEQGVLLTDKPGYGRGIASDPLMTAKRVLCLSWAPVIRQVVLSCKENCTCRSHFPRNQK